MTPPYLSRGAWGARAPKQVPLFAPPSERQGTTVHWNGPALWLADHANCAATVRGIQAWHMDAQGWADIAYSHLVCQHGYVFEGRGWAWSQGANGTDEVGAFDGPDLEWFTVCWLGGDGEEPTLLAAEAIVWCVREARARGAGQRVLPHSDFKRKSCPGPALTDLCRLLDGASIREGDVDKEQFKQAMVELFGGSARLSDRGTLQIRLSDGNWWDLADVLEFTHRHARKLG